MPTAARPSPPDRPVRLANRPARWGLVLVSILILGAAAATWRLRAREAAASHPRGVAADSEATASVRVESVRPTRGGLTRTSTQVGTVLPFEGARLFAKVSGYLKTQAVDIGSHVTRGQILAEIDDPEVVREAARAAAALAQAKAMVAQAEARVETATADAKAAAAAIPRADAEVASARSKRNYRGKELVRYRDLRAREAVPQQVVDEYEDHLETAVAQERSALAEVVSIKAQSDAALAKVDQARADLAEARSNVEVTAEVLGKAKVLVDYTRIISPYDGVITERNFFVGDFIRDAAEGTERPLLTVARVDKMRVVTYVADRDVPVTDVGDKAVVAVSALPGMTFEGKVARFSHNEDLQSRTMRTEIDLENPKGLLREGMYGTATLILESNTTNLTIPSDCLAGKVEDGHSSVFVAREGHAVSIPVDVGTDDGIRVEILKGLTPNDRVIISRGQVSEGTPVELADDLPKQSHRSAPAAGG